MFYVLLTLFLIALYALHKYWASYWERRKIPGPKPWPIIGNLGAHFRGKKTLGQVFVDIYNQYDGYPFVGVFRATTPCLLIRDPDFVTRLQVKDFTCFANNEISIDRNRNPLLGRNPFVLKDEEWRRTRQMLSAGFTSGRLKKLYLILQETASKLINYIEKHPTGTTDGIETRTLTKRFTLDDIAKAAFGIDGNCFESEGESEFMQLANKFLTPGAYSSIVLYLHILCPFISRLLPIKMLKQEDEDKMIGIVRKVMQYRKDSSVKANDYLQFVIDLGKEKGISEVEVTAYACTFFLESFATTSIVLSYYLYHLAKNPEYQEKVRKEIVNYEKENNGTITYEALREMPWLSACLNESMRLSPIMEALPKVCNSSYEYTPENHDFKKITVKLSPGDVVLVPLGMFTKDAKYFPEPEKFMPERWFNKEEITKKYFFPFGNGPRFCIGQRFARMEIKLGATHIIKNFEVSVSPKMQLPMSFLPWHPLNEVKGGIWLRYKKINPF